MRRPASLPGPHNNTSINSPFLYSNNNTNNSNIHSKSNCPEATPCGDQRRRTMGSCGPTYVYIYIYIYIYTHTYNNTATDDKHTTVSNTKRNNNSMNHIHAVVLSIQIQLESCLPPPQSLLASPSPRLMPQALSFPPLFESADVVWHPMFLKLAPSV